MELRALDEDLWAVDDVLKLGGLPWPVRTTLVRLADGGLVVLSPVPRLPALRAELEALGPVRALVAPNLLHHLGLAPALKAFPGARVFGRPGLARKRPDVRLTDTLGGVSDPLWSAELDQVGVGGMPRVEEVAFFHRASRTLVLTDLCFHVTRTDSLPLRLFLKLNGAWGRFGPSRLGRALMKERGEVRAAVDRMLAWGPERIVVAHGEVLERGGTAALREAFRFLG